MFLGELFGGGNYSSIPTLSVLSTADSLCSYRGMRISNTHRTRKGVDSYVSVVRSVPP